MTTIAAKFTDALENHYNVSGKPAVVCIAGGYFYRLLVEFIANYEIPSVSGVESLSQGDDSLLVYASGRVLGGVMANDVVTTYEGKDGYALVDKAQFEWLRREVERLTYLINGMKRDAKCYETAFDDAEAVVKQSVQKQMAKLRAENSRLKTEIAVLKAALDARLRGALRGLDAFRQGFSIATNAETH